MTQMLHVYEINVETLKIKFHEFPDEDFRYLDEDAGFALFNEDGWNRVYAESLVSAEDAKRLVLEKCIELRDQFEASIKEIEGSQSRNLLPETTLKLGQGENEEEWVIIND